MQWSKYNVIFKSKKHGHLLYNSLSNTLAEMDPDLHNKLQIIRKSPGTYDFGSNPPLFVQLRRAKVLVEVNEEKDLLDAIRMHRRFKRFNSSVLELTIAPTLNCNFTCDYCFLKSKLGQIRMNDETAKKVVEFVKQFGKPNVMSVIWFGGEPLLEFDRIRKLTKRLKGLTRRYTGGLVTNGYLLDRKRIETLDELSIDTIQVTIDGLETPHNRRRPHVNGDSYEKIVANIETLLKKWHGRCSIRVNVDRSNSEDFVEVYRHFQDRFGSLPNLEIYPGFITNDHEGHPDLCPTIGREDQAEFFVDLYRRHGIALGNYFTYGAQPGCMATNRNAFAIGPEGEIYNCWNDLGNQDMVVGSIYEDSQTGCNYPLLARYMLKTDVFDTPQCRKCFFLPVCDGGCTSVRMRRLQAGESINTCIPQKKKLREYLEIHCEQKKRLGFAQK